MNRLYRGLPFLALALLVLPLAVPFLAEDTDAADPEHLAQKDDISVSCSIDVMSIGAGDSMTFYLDIKNKLTDKDLVVYVYSGDLPDYISIEYTGEYGHRVAVDRDDINYCQMEITVDQFAPDEEYFLDFDIYISDPDRGTPITATASDLVRVEIRSQTNTDTYSNKFFGIWENHLPSFFGSSLFTTVVTFVAFLCLAYIIGIYVPSFIRHYRSDHGEA